jgi:hypothetical protein
MEIKREVVDRWQMVWNNICNMAYYRKGIVKNITTDPLEYNNILRYHSLKSSNFDEITLDHTWKKYSSMKNNDGEFLEALVVPELEEIYVPRLLFDSLGINEWFKTSFPNCLVSYWEYEL